MTAGMNCQQFEDHVVELALGGVDELPVDEVLQGLRRSGHRGALLVSDSAAT